MSFTSGFFWYHNSRTGPVCKKWDVWPLFSSVYRWHLPAECSAHFRMGKKTPISRYLALLYVLGRCFAVQECLDERCVVYTAGERT